MPNRRTIQELVSFTYEQTMYLLVSNSLFSEFRSYCTWWSVWLTCSSTFSFKA